MQTATQEGSLSKKKLWAGRIISGLVAAFMVFDGVMKVMKAAPVVEAAARLEYLLNVTVGIGALLLICTAIYVIPRTSVLGAILPAEYLGGATDANLHAGNPLFETLFPVIFGVLVWAGIFLREARLRELRQHPANGA